MGEYAKDPSKTRKEYNNGSSSPTQVKHTCVEPCEPQNREKAEVNRRTEYHFMESISTQSGDDDFTRKNVDDSRINIDKSVYVDSLKYIQADKQKVGECKYLDPNQDIIKSQFNLNINFLKKLNLSSTKFSASTSHKSSGFSKYDKPAYQPQRNLYMKKSKERFSSNKNTSQESEFNTRTDQLLSEGDQYNHSREHLRQGKQEFSKYKEAFGAPKDHFSATSQHLSSGKDLMSSRSRESRETHRSSEYYKNAPEYYNYHEPQTLPLGVSSLFQSSKAKRNNGSENYRATPSTHTDKSSNNLHYALKDAQNSPKYTHKTLKDVKLTSIRDYKQGLREYQSTHKYTHQSYKNLQYGPREPEHGLSYSKLSSTKESGHNLRDSQKSLKYSNQYYVKETGRDSFRESVVSGNDSQFGSFKHLSKPTREDRKLNDEQGTNNATEASYLRNPAARVRNVQFWFKPFSTSKSSSLNSYNGLQVIESLTGNVQKSWHLEAIKGLDRNNYGELKMTMLRLTNSRFNIHPNRLLIRCRGSWDVIQEGSFGTVYLGFVEGHGNSAVKVPNVSMLNYDSVGVMKRFINEWDILTRCSHRNIVTIYGGIILGVFDIWLCTELVNGVDLHTVKYGSTYSFGNQLHQMFNGSVPGVQGMSGNANNAQNLFANNVNCGGGNSNVNNQQQLYGGVVKGTNSNMGKTLFSDAGNNGGTINSLLGNNPNTAKGGLSSSNHQSLLGGNVNSSSNVHGAFGSSTLLANQQHFYASSLNSVKNSSTLNSGVANLKSINGLSSTSKSEALKFGSRTPRLIPSAAALKMCHQLADALVYLHTPNASKGIVIHRDIKPENIIVDSEWNIKLCDFGDAFESTNGQVNSVSGATWLYAPPELLLHPSIKSEFLTATGNCVNGVHGLYNGATTYGGMANVNNVASSNNSATSYNTMGDGNPPTGNYNTVNSGGYKNETNTGSVYNMNTNNNTVTDVNSMNTNDYNPLNTNNCNSLNGTSYNSSNANSFNNGNCGASDNHNPANSLNSSNPATHTNISNGHYKHDHSDSASRTDEFWPLSEKWDIWSFGCVIQEMFGYSGPFHHIVNMNDPPSTVCEKMVNAAYRGLVPNIPNQLAKTKMGALILQCLDPNPDNRPSALDIKLALQNPDILSP